MSDADSASFLDEIKPEDWRLALKRSLDAYRLLRHHGYQDSAALLVVAAQIDWAATIFSNVLESEE